MLWEIASALTASVVIVFMSIMLYVVIVALVNTFFKKE